MVSDVSIVPQDKPFARYLLELKKPERGLTHQTDRNPAVDLVNKNAKHAETDGQFDEHDTEGIQRDLCVLDMLETLVFFRHLDVVEVPSSAVHDICDEASHHGKRQQLQ